MPIHLTDRLFWRAVRRRFGRNFQIHGLNQKGEVADRRPPDLRLGESRELWFAVVTLRDLALSSWIGEKRLPYPDFCCGCGAAAEVRITVPLFDGHLPIWKQLLQGPVDAPQVPHCRECAHSDGQLILQNTQIGPCPATSEVHLLCGSRRFLDETAKLLSVGDVFPPWVTFPSYNSVAGGWRQGNGEFWLNAVWIPFWNSLTFQEQIAYVGRWNASPEWREWSLLRRFVSSPSENSGEV